jgi:hypothetical protein
MSFYESGRRVKFPMYPCLDAIVGGLPEEFERFVMEILIVMSVRELFADYRDKGSMVEVAHKIFLGAGILHAMVKWDGDIDRSLLPPCILVHPPCIIIVTHAVEPIPIPRPTCLVPISALVKVIFRQHSIYSAPLRVQNVF